MLLNMLADGACSAAVIPRSPDYLFQVKWDGVRLLAHVQGQRVWLHNRKLHNRTAHYPELTGLNRLIAGEQFWMGNRGYARWQAKFSLVLTRDLVNPGRQIFHIRYAG